MKKSFGRAVRSGSLCFLCLTMLLLSGCWNRKELNELSVVLAMGVDIEEGQYVVSVQVADPSQMARNRSADRSPTVVFTEKARTLFEALRKITTKASRKMYVSHLRLLVFSEEVAKRGIKEPLDFLLRDHEVRPDFHMAVAKDCDVKDIIGFVSPMEVLPAIDMYKSLKVSERAWAPTSSVNVRDMLQSLTKDGVEPVLTGITLIGEVSKGVSAENVQQPISKAEYKYSGIGMFQDDHLVGWMSDEESKAYNYIINNVFSTVGSTNCPQQPKERFLVEITSSKVRVMPQLQGDKPSVRLEVFIEANIGEVLCTADLTDETVFLQMENAAKKELQKVLEEGIRKAQKHGVDIFGFDEDFHRKYPRQWHRWKNDWSAMFMRLPVEIKMDYHLRKMGKIISPFDKPKKEE